MYNMSYVIFLCTELIINFKIMSTYTQVKQRPQNKEKTGCDKNPSTNLFIITKVTGREKQL